jgi:ferric-dicitrate binding protein FerR (iron transport regulator)
MGQEHIWNLIAKKLSGEASEEDLRDLEALLRNNPELHYPTQTIADLWNSQGPNNPKEALDAFDRHINRMQSLGIDFVVKDQDTIARPPKNFRKWIFSGFVMAIAVGGLFLYLKMIRQSPDQLVQKNKSEILTKNGSKTKLLLPDGTQVWLNGGSKISYDKNYGTEVREVSLTGEAFFDVVRNPQKPFLIHTGNIQIKVLGTAFNVKSYPDEENIETTLVRGSIEITFKDRPSEKVILKPNEKLIVANEENLPTPNIKQPVRQMNEPIITISHLNHEKSDSLVMETAWMQNKLLFRDQSFKELALDMERWYGVSIQFDNSQRDTLHFTGSFENETIQQALDALKLTAGKPVPDFQYIIKGNQITITK